VWLRANRCCCRHYSTLIVGCLARLCAGGDLQANLAIAKDRAFAQVDRWCKYARLAAKGGLMSRERWAEIAVLAG